MDAAPTRELPVLTPPRITAESPSAAGIAAEAAPPTPIPPMLPHNRVGALALHISWYGFRTQIRLARDSGVSPSAVSRLIRGRSQPSLAVALRVTRALSARLGKPLDLFEVFSLDGSYPTPSVCRLAGCADCLPPEAYDAEENLRPEFRDVRAGQWSLPPARGAAGKERV